jgi:hypothetical protein
MSPVATPFTAVLVEQQLGSGKPGNISTPTPRPARQPAAEIAEAQRVGALVPHEGRQQEMRQSELARLRQHPVMVLGHRHVERGSALLPVGISSFSAFGSTTAPDRMCAPTSLPFSRMQTETSRPASAASCFSGWPRTGRRALRRRSPRHRPWIRVRSSFPSSRRSGALPAIALLFLTAPSMLVED